jgi:hypothetical protein
MDFGIPDLKKQRTSGTLNPSIPRLRSCYDSSYHGEPEPWFVNRSQAVNASMDGRHNERVQAVRRTNTHPVIAVCVER